MLYNFFISHKFHKFCQSGCYFDFIYKKFSEIFIRNIFIYSSQFIGEKYIIEFLTKKIIDKLIFFVNKYIGWFSLKYFFFFLNFLLILFYFISFLNILIYLF